MERPYRHVAAASCFLAALGLVILAPGGAEAAAMKKLTVHVDGIRNNGAIPPQYAFCVPSEQGHTKPGANTNPAITWSTGPAGTKSYAVIVVYALDVPSLGLTGNFGGPDAQAAIAKHALAKGEIVGTYTQNPALMKKSKTVKKTS
jgi:phosphatidylethanolamine-binding protein (PEBP) family uncharacterized protein